MATQNELDDILSRIKQLSLKEQLTLVVRVLEDVQAKITRETRTARRAWQKFCADNSAKNNPLMMDVQRRYVAAYIKSNACTWSVRDSASAQWAAGYYFDVDADELRLLHPNDLVGELERAGLEVA